MKSSRNIFEIIIHFLKNELKILKIKFEYICTFLNEISLYKYLLSITNLNKNLGIFLSKYKNEYIHKLVKSFKDQKKNIKDNKKLVFVESFINHPLYTIPNCFIAKNISDEIGAECCGILRAGDITGSKIMGGFGVNKIIYINDGNFFLRLYYLFISYNHLKKLKSIKDLINFKIDKIEYGQAIYEQQIRFKKNPEIKTINIDFYLLLSKAMIHNYQFKNIFNKYTSSYLVQSETQYYPFRVCLQNALKFNHKVVSKRGISLNGIRVYKNFSERNENRNKISRKIFSMYYSKFNKKNLSIVNSLFLNHNKKNMGKDTYQQLNKERKVYKIINSKKNICLNFKWDLSKPIVIILAHELTDGNLNNTWNLFENDMFWLKETLKKISNIDNVNWLIKPHPSEKIYNAKISTKILFQKYCNNKKNIKLFPTNLKINNIKKIYHSAITSHGSAGFEFPGFSIPTVICGDTPYSSLGFNIEPKTKSHYFKILKNIKYLKLSSEAKAKCRFFNFLTHYLFIVKNPIVYESDITMKYNKEKFWLNSLKILKNHKNFNENFKSSLNNLIKSNNSILIDLNKFNLLKKDH